MKREEQKHSGAQQSAPPQPRADHLGVDAMVPAREEARLPQQHKVYAIPYDRHGQMQIPVKAQVNPYDPRTPMFGAGFPAAPGGNVERGETGADAVAREFREEMAPHGYKLRGIGDEAVHQESYVAGGGRNRREVVMSFIEATVAPAFGMKPDEIAAAGPEYRETSGVATVDPAQLGVDQTATGAQILVAVLRAVGIDPTTDAAMAWMGSGTATAIVASLRRRLPAPPRAPAGPPVASSSDQT